MERDLLGPRYPRSVLTGSASKAFATVLRFHLAGERVLDPTFGEGISWQIIDPLPAGLVRSDLKEPWLQDVFRLREQRPEYEGAFDLVYFDPPYFTGVDGSGDERREAYGGYAQATAKLGSFVDFAPELAWCLRPGGKIVLKCGDQYHVPSRRLWLHHLRWCAALERRFRIIDFYVYPFHHVSPTAYQVKDRPSAIVAHSYFIVGERVAS